MTRITSLTDGIKWYLILCVGYVIIAFIFYFAEGEQLFYRNSANSIQETNGDSIVGEMVDGLLVEQTFSTEVEEIESIGIMFSDYGRSNTNSVLVRLEDLDTSQILYEENVEAKDMKTNTYYYIKLAFYPKVQGHKLKISLLGVGGRSGLSPTVVFSSQYPLEGEVFTINRIPTTGKLCFSVIGRDSVWSGTHFLGIMGAIFIIISIIYLWFLWGELNEKRIFFAVVISAVIRYSFLISQLVSRDFKVKYKKSALGILWSFLNPLFTMSIQYIIFSQLFKSDIKFYPVYLLSGVVMFNFFSEAVVNSLMAIVGNASLITKVYVPKYIYPITKVLSSEINLLISLVPLLLMMLITVKRVTKAFILIPIPLLCITIFAMGVGLILCTCMVFFRDTQFLWGIFSMIWMYATPLFYPENILPDSFKIVHKINPLYYFIKILRNIIIDGIAPEPKLIFISVVMAVGTFLVGALVFKRNQDKFILYI